MTIQEAITDRQWRDTKSDSELAQFIAGQWPRAADQAIRNLDRVYRAAAGLKFALDPVNMIAINPVGELLNASYLAVAGSRPPLMAVETEPVVAWIRANRTAS